MAGGDLYVAQRDTGIECSHDERSPEHVRVHGSEFGPLADRANPSMRRAAVEALAVPAAQNRALVTLADGEVDGPGDSGNEGYAVGLSPLRSGMAFSVVADATRPPVLRWIEDRLGRPVGEDDVPSDVVEAAERDVARTPEDIARAQAVIDKTIGPLSSWWDDHDLLVTPATFRAGWPLGGQPGLAECGTLAAPFSLTGQPSLVVPVPDETGRAPVGVQIVGQHTATAPRLALSTAADVRKLTVPKVPVEGAEASPAQLGASADSDDCEARRRVTVPAPLTHHPPHRSRCRLGAEGSPIAEGGRSSVSRS